MDTSLKNIVLAGIGSLAYTYEKAEEMVDILVKKGELTINQGKELNEELKKVLDENKQKQTNVDTQTIKDTLSELDLPTKQDIEEIKTRLDNLEKNN